MRLETGGRKKAKNAPKTAREAFLGKALFMQFASNKHDALDSSNAVRV
jgi:hypothetical protein